ncbi:cupin domain-containing protein [Azohydromonas caseinilytica]|uniref:Cupin domain-containing protein n=1 Tax=Azohydromonas caseinilytica TaxID=2728836 RepID=A0A848FDZ1_9BURK|nr:cupin domain-containing protein [Azohydromonas caseinilytica]NML16370.1 cupin domain-containing protein [Azohydromonas caseinilytica]
MTVLAQPQPQPTGLPGIAHATWAGRDEGLQQLSVWRQSLAPGAATPPHGHGCDEVVFCLAGHGEAHIDGAVHAFGPDTTVVLPRRRMHQLVNTGTEPLELLAVFAATPVDTQWPDGQEIALPWRS